jgi:type IV pilus assembly protein PilP
MNLPSFGSRLLAVSLMGLFLLTGCGEEKTTVATLKKGTAPGTERKKAAPPKADETKDGVKEETYSYNPAGKPDPFKPFLLLTPVRGPQTVPLTPLQKYEISQLKLVAILFTPEGNTALVEDATGKGYFVKRGTLVGKNDGKVARILKDRVIIEEVYLDVLGQRKVNEAALMLQRSEEGGEK